jgi:hypothetical protein
MEEEQETIGLLDTELASAKRKRFWKKWTEKLKEAIHWRRLCFCTPLLEALDLVWVHFSWKN